VDLEPRAAAAFSHIRAMTFWARAFAASIRSASVILLPIRMTASASCVVSNVQGSASLFAKPAVVSAGADFAFVSELAACSPSAHAV
jgi:hypothetical protein